MSELLATMDQLTAVREAVCARKAAQQAAGVMPIRICLGASCIASVRGESRPRWRNN